MSALAKILILVVAGLIVAVIVAPRSVVLWVALGLAVMALVGVEVWRRRHPLKIPAPAPDPSVTLDGVEVIDMEAEIDSTAQKVARDTKVGRWTGPIHHRPGSDS